MKRKKNPSFLLVFLQVIAQSIWELVIAVISAGIAFSQSYGTTIKMLETVPVWIWWGVASVFTLLIVAQGIRAYKRELNDASADRVPNAKQTNVQSQHYGMGDTYTAERIEIHQHGPLSKTSQNEFSLPRLSLTPRVEKRYVRNIEEIRTAYLEVKNKADKPITDCYATLETAEFFKEPYFSPILIYKNVRLKWDEKYYPDNDCKLSIPPTETKEIRVFKSLAEIWGKDGNSDFGFSLCQPSGKVDGFGVYLLRIRIDGKQNVDGRDVEIHPEYFEGYLYVDIRTDVFDAIEHHTDIQDGETVKHERHINKEYTRPVMYFENGDWKQDQRIPVAKPTEPFEKDPYKSVGTPESARQICTSAEQFGARFRHIRDAFVSNDESSEAESSGKGIHFIRHEKAKQAFKEVVIAFESSKYHLDCRVELQDNIGRLAQLFERYSRQLSDYSQMREQQAATPPGLPLPYGDLESYVNELFGSKATEVFDEVDTRVESIIQMLTPYIRGEK